ncbi:MAG: methyltransferase domain-containing protein [Litorilinea sp.]
MTITSSTTNVNNNRARDAAAKAESAPTRLLLICHAEGMQDRYSDLGAKNGGLTALGWEQSDALADWLRVNSQLDTLVTDGLLQSRLTAQRLGQGVLLPVTVYREFPAFPAAGPEPVTDSARLPRQLAALATAASALAGDGAAPVEPAAPDMPAADVAGSATDAPALQAPDAATATASNKGAADSDLAAGPYIEELVSALDRLIGDHWGKTLALVTSREVIGVLLQYVLSSGFLRASSVAVPAVELDHTGISELIFRPLGWRVRYMNRVEHLPTLALPDRAARDMPPQTAAAVENLTSVIRVYNRVSKVVGEQKRESDIKRVHHLVNFAKLPADQQILDIGTGLGVLPLVLAEEGAHTVVGIDVSPGMLEQAEYHRLRSGSQAGERVSFRLAAAQALPFHDERFGAVFCRLLLNHTQKPEQVIHEAVRVLRPGGVFILADMLSVDNAVKRATQNAIEEKRNPAHVAARNAEQYAKMLEDAGLVIEAQESVSFERELEEWLSAFDVDRADRAIVREMIEAGIETDAAGMNARRQGDTVVFVQRMYYLRALKPAVPAVG